LLAFWSAVGLVGCAAAAVDHQQEMRGFCENSTPIRIAVGKDKMTLETAKQIIDHNARGAKLCGWKP